MYTERAIENIRKFRELKQLTREQVAADLEMSPSGYGRLERGEVELTVLKLEQIAKSLNVSISQILDFDASRVFNISHNQVINGVEIQEQHHHSNTLQHKYIAMLEGEVLRLKEELSRCKEGS